MKNFKIVVVGDGAVGKTSMLISYHTNSFPTEYIPTLFDPWSTNITYKGEVMSLSHWDTAGQEDYDQIRPLSYPKTDVFLVCFSTVNRSSFENVRSKWIPEIRRHCPATPFLLVGTKIDLLNDPTTIQMLENRGTTAVTKAEARSLAKELGGLGLEWNSALTCEGLTKCFNDANDVAFNYVQWRTKPRKWFHCGTKKSSRFSSRGPDEDFWFSRVPVEPSLPKTKPPPYPSINLTNLDSDRFKLLKTNDEGYADVTFIVGQDQERVLAHKAIICISCSVFSDLMNTMKSIEGVEWIKEEEEEEEEGGGGRMMMIKMDEKKIKETPFKRFIEFLYNGKYNKDSNSKDNDTKMEEIGDMIAIGELFQMKELVEICRNLNEHKDHLNESISESLVERWGRSMYDSRENRKESKDSVSFKVGEGEVVCDRSMISCRSEVLSAMISKRWNNNNNNNSMKIESVDRVRVFEKLIEFIYIGKIELDNEQDSDDILDILKAGDHFGLPELVQYCEVHVCRAIELSAKDSEGLAKNNLDIFSLLNFAQMYHASQVESFCLHILSHNYRLYKEKEGWLSISEESRKHCKLNQWPPLSYYKEYEEYLSEKARYGAENGSKMKKIRVNISERSKKIRRAIFGDEESRKDIGPKGAYERGISFAKSVCKSVFYSPEQRKAEKERMCQEKKFEEKKKAKKGETSASGAKRGVSASVPPPLVLT